MIDLFKAAYENDADKVRAAIAEGQNPDAQHERAGTIPLQLACQGNALDSIRELLVAGADPNREFTRTSRVDGRVFGNRVPLMYAKSVAAAALLLEAGANLEATDSEGNTPLVSAVFTGDPDLFGFLLERGARVDVKLQREGQPLSLIDFVDAHRRHVRDIAGASPNIEASTLLTNLDKIHDALATADLDRLRVRRLSTSDASARSD